MLPLLSSRVGTTLRFWQDLGNMLCLYPTHLLKSFSACRICNTSSAASLLHFANILRASWSAFSFAAFSCSFLVLLINKSSKFVYRIAHVRLYLPAKKKLTVELRVKQYFIEFKTSKGPTAAELIYINKNSPFYCTVKHKSH